MMSSSPSSQSLKAWLEPDETAAEFLNRVRLEALRTGVFFMDQALELRPGHVVEVTGASGSCKTDILVQVRVAACDAANGQSLLACRDRMGC
ncbi:hypothetical protein H632_c2872p0 [Helicosporidium sp. ATCC 50920]|nr:hypothetical protein H632_c2872p0 [Helicosporidium sp. ATCC 50920]|eukprot:KDD72808.1 hypothetical protein H632_c2872p0 [Helicosporidium sp. ATCC 50920]